MVKPGDRLFLNDGLVQLVVERVAGHDVQCKVAVGGELRSKKGLNLPGIGLGISAFTDQDRACLELAFSYGVQAEQFTDDPENRRDFARNWLRGHQRPGVVAMLVAGPSTRNPAANHRIEFLRVGETPAKP